MLLVCGGLLAIRSVCKRCQAVSDSVAISLFVAGRGSHNFVLNLLETFASQPWVS